MQRGVQITQAFRNEIGKAVKTKRLTTGRTQKAFALDVGTTATTLMYALSTDYIYPENKMGHFMGHFKGDVNPRHHWDGSPGHVFSELL